MPSSKKNGTGFVCEECGANFAAVAVYGGCTCAHCPKCGGSSVEFATPTSAAPAVRKAA